MDLSSLFGAQQTNNNSFDYSASMLSDWSSIKNGSYGKLTKAYYGKNENKNAKVSEDESDEMKKTIKANNTLKNDATSVKSSLEALSKSDLYEKIDTKDADGNAVKGYDTAKILKNVKSFVDAYNGAIKSSVDSDNNGVLRNALSMTKITNANSNLLSEIGITINEDNTLSVDESKVKGANVNDIKSLFQGGGSYADQIEARASELINQINRENNKLSNYTAAGVYNNTNGIGNIYDGTY